MILYRFLVDQHAAHEYEGENEEPESWYCEICKEHLHILIKPRESYFEVQRGHKEGD